MSVASIAESIVSATEFVAKSMMEAVQEGGQAVATLTTIPTNDGTSAKLSEYISKNSLAKGTTLAKRDGFPSAAESGVGDGKTTDLTTSLQTKEDALKDSIQCQVRFFLQTGLCIFL